MNIAILSRGEGLYSTRSLFLAGESRNHVMEVIDPNRCTQAIVEGRPVLYYNDELVEDLHAVIPRIGASNTYFGAALVRHLQAMGAYSPIPK